MSKYKNKPTWLLVLALVFYMFILVSVLSCNTKHHVITEDGVNKPKATFSACYGEAFIVWRPIKYATLLSKKMEKHNVNCYLVNTGWVGGKYGITPIIGAILDTIFPNTGAAFQPAPA